MIPGQRGDRGLTFLSFIHYAVCVTQHSVVTASFSGGSEFGTVAVLHTFSFLFNVTVPYFYLPQTRMFTL
jgi:hypothetical protein